MTPEEADSVDVVETVIEENEVEPPAAKDTVLLRRVLIGTHKRR